MKNYYIGINGTNVICNDEYFDGYITAYPMGEVGNISYFDSPNNNTLDEDKFSQWAKTEIEKVLQNNSDVQFTFFNKKMASICSFLPKQCLNSHNDWQLLEFLNDKFKIRNYLSKNIKVLDYLYLKGSEIKYSDLTAKLNAKHFVLQSQTGSGGLTTHNITNNQDISDLNLNKNDYYSISSYQENLPVNATLMISKNDIYQLPISVQLIKNTGNFIYCGGDFIFPKRFKPSINKHITSYNTIIGKELQKLGYRGICGVDYIICPNGTIMFMELNPRFQGSSFLISIALKDAKTSIARLNADCFSKENLDIPHIELEQSFVNCISNDDYSQFGKPTQIIKKVENSTFRKIFNKSICLNSPFEAPKDLSSICMDI